jgi:hypothetical protein
MIPPNIAILPEQMKELGAQLALRNWSWFERRDIECMDRGGIYWLLRKKPGPRNHWNILCNGTVYTKNGTLVSLPPIKLYDLNEAHINIKDADLIQKIKGEMVCVFWEFNSFGLPCFHSDHDLDMESEAVTRIKAAVDFNYLKHDPNYTLTFVVDEYVNLVHARHIKSLREYAEHELDSMADELLVERPYWFPVKSMVAIKEAIRENPDMNFLLRDVQTGERANFILNILRREKLVAQGRWKHLVPYWLDKCRELVIDRFPFMEGKFIEIDDRVRERLVYIRHAGDIWRQMNLPKREFYSRLSESREPAWAKPFIINIHDKPPEKWDEICLEGFHKMTSKMFISTLSLVDGND